jgi:hypothetical protein
LEKGHGPWAKGTPIFGQKGHGHVILKTSEKGHGHVISKTSQKGHGHRHVILKTVVPFQPWTQDKSCESARLKKEWHEINKEGKG